MTIKAESNDGYIIPALFLALIIAQLLEEKLTLVLERHFRKARDELTESLLSEAAPFLSTHLIDHPVCGHEEATSRHNVHQTIGIAHIMRNGAIADAFFVSLDLCDCSVAVEMEECEPIVWWTLCRDVASS